LSRRLSIRAATAADVGLLHRLIVALAEYERAPDAVSGTPQMLGEALFGKSPVAEALIAEVDGEPAGFALFHGTFSTWECSAGLWLEDLYVDPAHRRGGVGGALLQHLAALAVERGCTRLEWAALDWNVPALRFYEQLGATVLKEWLMHRLDGAALASVAGVGGSVGEGGCRSVGGGG
jgi:GNAT superfamily N-acetyltransferase